MVGLLSPRRDSAPALPGPVVEGGQLAGGQRGDSVVNPFTGLGSWADKGSVGRPNLWQVPLTDQELSALYATNGIARRIIDILPSRATRKGWRSPEIPTGEYKRLRAWARVRESMAMAGLHGGALLLMVTEDDVPPRARATVRARPLDWLREPLDTARIGKLHALQLFDAQAAWPQEWERDIRSPGYRMPSLWSLSGDGFAAVVHSSRVIHFRGARRPPSEIRWGASNVMPDASRLQAIWDEIRRLTETMQGGATLAQELRESVLKINNFGARMVGDEAAALRNRLTLMGQMRGILGMILLGEGDEYESRSNPPTGFDMLSDAAKSMLAGVSGIPEVVLFGATPGGLSTDGDSSWQGFHQLISDYQETQREELERLDSVICAAQDGPTGGVVPDESELEFAPLDEPDEQEDADLRKSVAEMDAIYIDAGVYGPEEVARSRFGADGWTMELDEVPIPDPEEDAAIEAARALLEAGVAGGGAGAAGGGAPGAGPPGRPPGQAPGAR